mmetsp:Transcript_10879/g.24721  ORF Transcript_10879/g.24721 Transcript_10879/m.24721 type:complete len:282 (+) Transcript_10879:4950-5795(+)
MQVLAHQLHKVAVDHVASEQLAGSLGQRAHSVDNLLHLVTSKEVRHLPRVEDVVDVFEEGLAHKLRVVDQEHAGQVGGSRRHEDLLEVLMELIDAVHTRELNLEELVLGRVARKAGERLTSRPANADEAQVATRLAQHTAQTGDVLDGVAEKDEVHGLVVGERVVLGVVLQHLGAPLQVCNLLVARRPGFHEVAEDSVDKHLLVPSDGKVRGQHFLLQGCEPGLVAVVNQTVGEHASRLVAPESDKGCGVRQISLFDHKDALDHLGEVAQVEGVVRVRRRG